MPHEPQVLEIPEAVKATYFALAERALVLAAQSLGPGEPDEDEEFNLARRIGHGLEIAHALNPMKRPGEWTTEELIGLGEYKMYHLKLIVAPIPFRPLPTPGDRLAGYGRAITAEELSRELGVSTNSISKQMEAGSIPYFHVCTCLRFCPVTIARSIQTVFDRINEPSIIERLIAWDHGRDAEELAGLLYVHYKTILKAANRETLPCYREGTLVRFNGRAVARWLSAQMFDVKATLRKPSKRVILRDTTKAGLVGVSRGQQGGIA